MKDIILIIYIIILIIIYFFNSNIDNYSNLEKFYQDDDYYEGDVGEGDDYIIEEDEETTPAPKAKAASPKAKASAPKATAPKATAPKATAPKASAPKAAAPKAAAPKAAAPKSTSPKATSPKATPAPKAASSQGNPGKNYCLKKKIEPIDACEDGYNNANDVFYCGEKYASTENHDSKKAIACAYGQMGAN